MQFIWHVNIAALLLAIPPLPYLFYIALRLLVSGSAVYLIVRHQRRWQNQMNGWKLLFAAIAIVYNPVIPVYLPKIIWIVVNLVTAVLFYIHLQTDPVDEQDSSSN